MTKTERKAIAWIFSGATGSSSLAMCQFFLLGKTQQMWGPADAGDFGRCHRLLQAVPEWRRRVPELAALGGEWKGLAREWDSLEAIYLSGDDNTFYQAIRRARGHEPRKKAARCVGQEGLEK